MGEELSSPTEVRLSIKRLAPPGRFSVIHLSVSEPAERLAIFPGSMASRQQTVSNSMWLRCTIYPLVGEDDHYRDP